MGVLDPRTIEALKRIIRGSGLSILARAILAQRPAARASRRRDLAELANLEVQLAAIRTQMVSVSAGTEHTALVIGMGGVAYIMQQLPMLAGAVAAGYVPVVLLPSRGITS